MSGTSYLLENTNQTNLIQQMDDDAFNQSIIQNILKELSQDPSVPAEIRAKLHDEIMFRNFQQISKITTPTGSQTVILGLTQIQPPEFTHFERHTIARLIDKQLKDLLKDLQCSKVNEEDMNASDEILFEARDNLHESMFAFMNNSMELKELLEEVKVYQDTTLPDVCSNKQLEVAIQHKMNKARLSLIEHSTQIKILTENTVSLQAYQELYKIIKEEQKQLDIEINQMKDLKTKYQLADSVEYREVLKEYLEYELAIEKFNMMHKLMQNKS